MRKPLIFTLILIVAVAGVSILYFSNLSTGSRQNNKVLSLIPADAAMVAGFRYDESFLEIYKDYQPFNAIIGEDKRAEIDQIYNTFLTQPQLRQAIQGQNFFLSFHPTTQTTELLWLIPLNNQSTKEGIWEALKSIKEITLSESASAILDIKLNSFNKNFYLYINDGFVLGSFKKQLIEACLNQEKTKINPEFIAKINTESQQNSNSLFNLFINHQTTSKFIANFYKNKLSGDFNLLKDLKGFSTLNMNFKSDALMFNGISTSDTAINSYLNLFLHQKPVPNTIKKVFPINTANFLAFGVSNNKSFNNDLRILLKKRGDLKRLEQQVQKIKSETGINFEKNIKPLWGKEFTTFQLANGEKLAAIQVLNGQKIGFLLEPVSQEYAENIRRLNYPRILYYYFGDPLNLFPRPLYTVVDNYLIVSNTASAIEQFLTDYKADKLLIKEQGFLEFNQLVANQSNIFYFAHTKNSQQIIRNSLQKSYAKSFATEKSGLKDFYGLSLQWGSEGSHFFTNLCASYIGLKAQSTEALWKFKLNGPIILAPQAFIDTNAQKLVLVQDKSNMLYAISTEGKKFWSIQLNDKVLGPIKQLEDKTLLFNTAQKIYRIDAEGNNITGFPISLPQNATYGNSISSLKTADCKIYVPCSNTILGYSSSGELLANWPQSVESPILFDIKTAALNHTQYVIAGTTKGKFYFFNSSGVLLKKVEDSRSRFRNPLALAIKTDIKDSRIITSDTTGTVKSIFFDGGILKKSIGTWTPEHLFDYKNISGDINPEFVYLDKNQLYIYNTDGNLIFNYEFPYPIKNKPQFFIENQSIYKIGIASGEDHLLYLFNNDGTLVKGFPFKGEPNFYVGNLRDNEKIYLICGGKDNYLYAYSL